ncbi:copper resistance-associated p-type ATPase [Grosmannia clavigera kw1407]|uniref:Copper resistance-associated P-type ATPase n=1 Tax=Grosmannia clavigera (strain kw1407 / UAMH 11150) TaxID=655863 RepID=F0X9N2_GROCL|nr:copper resistance-associated p-type ATPase [Grosmannia clavigera kw1407]EFX05980.1 copper resistance-associated p-type ATPase [Grosmannia clavigera kw1407]
MAPTVEPVRRVGGQNVTSSFLVGNLHCPSCVSTIRDVLQEACGDHVRWVSPNIVTSVVTVEHDREATLRCMTTALTEAGFEICGVTSSTGESFLDLDLSRSPSRNASGDGADSKQQDTIIPQHPASSSMITSTSIPTPQPASSWGFSPLSRWMASPKQEQSQAEESQERILQAHLDNCEQCRLQKSLGKLPVSVEVKKLHEEDTDTEDESPGSRSTESPPTAPNMSEKGFVTIEDEDAPGSRPTWRASLAIGGMTCAVCTNTITDELKKREWVSKVAVNLISNSATVEFDEEQRLSEVIEAIEDMGYDAALDSLTRVESARQKKQQEQEQQGRKGQSAEAGSGKRTVEIMIEGLYCEYCPERIVRSLAGFRRASLAIETRPTPQRPIVRLSYVPEAPQFTIRQILAAIEASDGALTASLYHAPTLEQRSKLIRARHQRQMLWRVVWTGATCVPTFVIGIVYMSLLRRSDGGRQYLTAPWISGINRAQIALFVMATPVYFCAADIFHVRAFKEIRTLWRRGSRTPVLQRFYRFGSMNTLISLGTTIAYISSVCQMIAAAADRATMTDDGDFYFDSVIFLTFFLLVGRLIEAYSKSRTGDAVEMLGRLRPTTAQLVERGESEESEQSEKEKTTEVQADLLEHGDVVRVRHGASPPADGEVVSGQTSFDESSLTGESRLISKTVGDAVYAGTVNKDGAVLVRVTGGAGSSMLDQIVAAVREGQTKRAPMEQIADVLTTYFVPVVTLVAIVTWVVWLGLGLSGRLPESYLDKAHTSGSGAWVAFSLQFAIAVFVVACPCGLGLAAPTAIFVGGGMAARYGILAKGGGEAFEKASRIDCVVFDKTGTLTVGGEPTVTDVVWGGGQKDKGLVAALCAVEETSSHPIAKAIVSFCQKEGDAVVDGRVDMLQETAGRGMRARYCGGEAGRSFDLIVGNEALMADYSVEVSSLVAMQLQQWKSDAKSVALVGWREVEEKDDEREGTKTLDRRENQKHNTWTLAAALSISDPVRPEAAPILAALQARGLLVYMLSGDNAVTAAAVARQLGIPADQVIAEVLPTEKAARIQALQASLPGRSRWGKRGKSKSTTTPSRATVAMVGDGINDAPALTQADVGIAVGSGSDVAISSADFVLIQSSLQAVVTLLDLSRAVFRRIALNFAWALVYNVVAVPIAAGVLYPVHTRSTRHVRLDPVWASLAMALSSVSVVCSSLVLRSRIPGLGFRPSIAHSAHAEQTSASAPASSPVSTMANAESSFHSA